MTRRRAPDANEGASPATGSSSPPPVIEATLEPDDDTPSTERTQTGASRSARSDTVVMRAATGEQRSDEQGGRYMLMRPDRIPASSLLVCMGANVGHRYSLAEPEAVIGRSSRCDIQLNDDRVSSRHAELVRRGTRYRIYDLGSANGTLVNAQRVDEIDLRDGDLIQVGFTVFRYISGDAIDLARNAGPPAAVPPAAPPQQAASAGAAVATDTVTQAPAARARRDDEEMSFADMVQQLRRLIEFFWPFRWVIVGLGLLGFIGGGISVLPFPPAVRAVFDVRLHSKASNNPLERFDSANIEFFRSAGTTFRSTTLIEKTLTDLGTASVNPGQLQAVQLQLSFDNTGGDQNSQTYAGSYQSATPEQSLAFLEKHVDNYLQGEIEKTLKIIGSQVDFLSGQLGSTEKDLKETEARLLEFKRKNIDGLPDQARQYYDYLFELQRRESDLAASINRLEAEAYVDQQRLSTETPLVESRVLATRPYQQAIVEVNQRLAQARASGLGDDHPDVRELKAKLEELRRLATEAERTTDDTEIERSRNPVYESALDRLSRLRASAAATRSERARLAQDQVRVKAIVEKLPQLEAQYADLTRSYDATKELHTRIFDQLKTAELQYALEKASASARYEIITPPRLEASSLMRVVVKRAGSLLIAGILFGVFIAVAAQARRLLAQLAPAR
ncbi:MAG: FHA domain-containing protein [Deltaproteobacteria bacterium]|nr:FHA domain-containing protein [Deltaproteobacteria bacterium]